MSEFKGADEGPIEPKYHTTMNALAHGIDDILNGKDCKPREKKTGFVLIMFDINDGPAPKEGRFNYISNSERCDVLATMKEVIARNEGRYQETKGKQ